MEVGDDHGKGLPSRSAMSKVRSLITDALGVDDEEAAKKIADKYVEKYGVEPF